MHDLCFKTRSEVLSNEGNEINVRSWMSDRVDTTIDREPRQRYGGLEPGPGADHGSIFPALPHLMIVTSVTAPNGSDGRSVRPLAALGLESRLPMCRVLTVTFQTYI